MSEVDRGRQSEIAGKLIREPQIQEMVSPVPSYFAESLDKGSGRGREVFGATSGVPERDGPVTFSREVDEDQSMVPGGRSEVLTTLEVVYDAEGFPITSRVVRGEGSVFPSVEKVFTYGESDAEGRKQVIQIDGFLLLPEGTHGTHAVRQKAEVDQATGELKTRTEYFPGNEELNNIVDLLTTDPKALRENYLGQGAKKEDGAALETRQGADTAQRVYEYCASHPKGPLLLTAGGLEEGRMVIDIQYLRFFSAMGDFTQLQRITLNKMDARCVVEENSWYNLWGSTSKPGYFPEGSIAFSYDKRGYLVGSEATAAGKLLTQDRFVPRFLRVRGRRRGDTEGIEVFDIDRTQYDPNEEVQPGRKPKKKKIKLDFVKYVILRDAMSGKNSNFGVSVTDRCIYQGQDNEVVLIARYIFEKGQLIGKNEAPQGTKLIGIERTVTLPSGRKIRVNLQVTESGSVDDRQRIHGVTLVEDHQ